MMDFAEIVLSRMRELGVNVNQAEARAGFEQGYIRGVVRNDDKRAVPNVEKAKRIAESLGLDFYIGPPRKPPVTHLPGQLHETPGGGPPVLAPPTGFVTFVWHRACDPDGGIPPLAFSQALAVAHGLDPDRHLMVCAGPRPQRPQDPGHYAVIDPEAPRSGGPALWAFQDGLAGKPVEIARIQFLGNQPVALPTPGQDAVRNLHRLDVALLGRVLWISSKPP